MSTMAGLYDDIVDEDTLESEWTNSAAKAFLEELVANGRDQEDGKNIRANILYKKAGCFEHLKDFPQKFITQKLKELRNSSKKAQKTDHSADQKLLQRWKSSRAKIVMERIVQHGFDCDDKGKLRSAREVYQLDKEFSSFPQPFVTMQLKIARKGKPKPPAWGNSRARAILSDIIAVGMDRDDVGNELSVMDVYELDPHFEAFPLKRFRKYLEELRESIYERQEVAQRDANAVSDYLSHNEPSLLDAPRLNYKRYPKWQGSMGQKLLHDDLEILIHEGLMFSHQSHPDRVTPMELYEYREEYQKWPLSVFRNHIYKEMIHDKQVAWNKHKKRQAEQHLK